jgi:hypothetical protein
MKSMLTPIPSSTIASPLKIATSPKLPSPLISPFKVYKDTLNDDSMSSELKKAASQILALYMYYTSYGDRLNLVSMKSSNFHHLLIDAGIEKTEEDKINMDILFKKSTKNAGKITFHQFTQILVPIGKLLYPDKGTESSKEVLLHLQQLMKEKESQISSSSIGPYIVKLELPQIIIEIFCSTEPMLYDIYCFYFPHELSTVLTSQELYNKSVNNALLFVNEFDICPGVISKPLIYYILFSCIEAEDSKFDKLLKKKVGRIITFPKFIEYIAYASVYSKIPLYQNLTGVALIR